MKKIFCLLAITLLNLVGNKSVWAIDFGSKLQGTPNAFWGCELAPILDPINGFPTLAATGQTTCTMRNVGYINDIFTVGSYVPQNGKITRFKVKSGSNPAPLRLTIFTGSPGLCCTARKFGKVFQPKPNKVTTIKTDIKVFRALHSDGSQTFDIVGLTAVGPGTLPLSDQGTAGTFASGSGLTQLWFPATAKGDPRVEGYTADGLELLLQWRFKPNK